METKIEQLKRENETLKREIAELKETNRKLKESLDEAVRSTKPRPQPAPRGLKPSQPWSRASSEAADRSTDSDLQEQLSRAIQQLSETRRQLLDKQDRLTVTEQVTAATQRRQLVQEGLYENLPPDSVYEKLRFDPAQEHVYAKLQTHTDVVLSQYSYLASKLDAHVTAVHMYERNALTVKDLESIQSLRDRPVKAAETLLNIILEQPFAVYECFLDVLKQIGQQHIYQTLVEGAYKDYDDQQSHTSVIRSHYVFLLETLDVKFSGLVGQLYSDHVVSAAERDDISAEQTSFRANEKLLSVLSRKSPQQFQQFLDALDNCGQLHVRNVIDLRVGQVVHTLPEGLRVMGITSLAEGQVVHTLPEGLLPVYGITSLAGEIYLVRPERRDQVEVYDVISYRLQRCLTVPDSKGFADMTSCEHYHCVYISDPFIECIHRLGVQGAATRWPVNDKPWGLSVNAAHSLLVACNEVRKIKEFSSHGDLLRELTLPGDVTHPCHAIQLTNGQLVVCHGDLGDPLNRVCMISADGRHIVHSHGGQRGSDTGQYRGPFHLAVDNNEFVFVADYNNRRVTLLSPTLHYVRQVVSSDKLKGGPDRLYLDVQRRRLYVADNEHKDGKVISGRVVVFSV